MKKFLTKISFITLTSIFLISCSAIKRVPDGKYLLSKNEIFVDSIKTKNAKLYNQLYLKPNIKLIGIPLRLHLYNLAAVNPDSTYLNWLHKKPNREKRMVNLLSKKQVDRLGVSYTKINNWLKKTGEPPSIISDHNINRSLKRLQAYYWNNGWFNVKTDFAINKRDNKRASIKYYAKLGKPYTIDSIKTNIESKAADSIYQINKTKSTIITGKQYNTLDIDKERERITSLFRNSGLYHFEKEYITYDADTINTNHTVNLNLQIKNRQITTEDSIHKTPFKIHNISKVNIFTDYSYLNRNTPPQDTLFYKGYTIYSYGKQKYTRKSLISSVLITPGSIFKEQDKTHTYTQINNLKTFKYPNIRYDLDPNDPKGTDLIANILLTPRKKYSTNVEFDISTSTIQAYGLGFGGSFIIRNIFRGAETFKISARGNIGSSKEAANGSGEIFNISEIGVDFKLSFPRILLPFNTNKIIPKYMSPNTNLIFGINTQENIGLDKKNASGIFNYQWKPNKIHSNQIDVINIQYVRNYNTKNYFNIYKNSFTKLNNLARNILSTESNFFHQGENKASSIDEATLIIPGGANGFIAESLKDNPKNIDKTKLQEIKNIKDRKDRLTEDNLILASSYTYTKNNSENLFDENYSRFKAKIEFAGNILSSISKVANLNKIDNNNFEIFGVEFSQYIKTELDYIKHLDLGRKNILAFRAYGGIAIPYGNSNSIPFARSFFGGGPNDNRAWLAYALGPGSSGGNNEFNEANFKLAFNAEYRFNILGSFKGALFVDAGNIWNIKDNIAEEDAVFSKLSDLKEIAVGSGIGIRYDFGFFVLRFDTGFKTFNPAKNEDQRWFKGYNFSKATFHLGINYPF